MESGAGGQSGDLRPGIGTLVAWDTHPVSYQGGQARGIGQVHDRDQSGG